MTIPQPKTRDDLIALLSITDPDELQALYDAAYAVKAAGVGRVVYYRGLVEFSNYCIKDCKYCGIRKSNDEVERFDTPREDILAMARWAWENRYGSLTLQSGERQDEEFIDYVEGLVRDIKDLSHGELGLTLCVGEQTEETYRRWFDAGAHRYLLRIETSNPDLYATLHPQDGHHRWQVRKDCLDSLRRIGYQVGTGDMIGLPGQTLGDLADDILFYRDMDIDMIGMVPTSSITIHRSAKSHGCRYGQCRRKETAPGTGPQDDRRYAPLPARRQHRRHDGPPGPPSPGTGTGPQSRGQRPHAHRHGPQISPTVPLI